MVIFNFNCIECCALCYAVCTSNIGTYIYIYTQHRIHQDKSNVRRYKENAVESFHSVCNSGLVEIKQTPIYLSTIKMWYNEIIKVSKQLHKSCVRKMGNYLSEFWFTKKKSKRAKQKRSECLLEALECEIVNMVCVTYIFIYWFFFCVVFDLKWIVYSVSDH